MTTLDPRQLWRHTDSKGNPGACKTTHLLHAWLKNGKFVEKWHKKTGFYSAGLGGAIRDIANASRGSLFNPASTESEFQHWRRLSLCCLIVEYRIDLTRSHVDASRYCLFDHAAIRISAAKRGFYNGMWVFIQNKMIDR